LGSPRSPQSPQEHAQRCYLWQLAADRLLFHLTYRLHPNTDGWYRADLEYFRACLNEPDLPSMLATLFGNGHDAAKELVLRHRDHMVAAGYAVGTINRHLCTIRKVARIAREMGEISWDLQDVPEWNNPPRAYEMDSVGPAGNAVK
jgi:hypothetical protein